MNLFDVYPLYPVEPIRGCGSYVYDAEGQEYLDLYGGHAVISIGHAHPHYVEAISKQVAALGFYSNSVENSLQREFAERLGRACGYEDYRLFLCNSGAEANENAIKLASFQSGKEKVLAFSRAFHGRTSGAVAATDNPKIVSPFNRTKNVEFVALNDLAAVEAKLAEGGFLLLAMLLLLGVFVACKSKPQKEQPFDTEPNTEIATEDETTDQSPETETEQPNEPAPVLDLRAQTLSAESDQVLLSLSCEIFEQGLEGELSSRLTKGDQELAQGRTPLVPNKLCVNSY